MLRDPVTGDIPWPGFIFGQFPSSTWYWCADQMMVQRVLSAKSISHAQGALVFAGQILLLETLCYQYTAAVLIDYSEPNKRI